MYFKNIQKCLFIKIGNSTITFCLFYSQNKIKKIFSFPIINFFNPKKFNKNVVSTLEKLQKDFYIKFVFICSVNKKKEKILLTFLFKLKKICFCFKNKKHNLVKLNKIEDPNEVGNDLIASCNYLLLSSKDFIFVSLGTNSVILVVKNSYLEGVLIMPGIKKWINTIFKNSDISSFDLLENDKRYNKNDNLLGKNTFYSIKLALINTINFQIEKIKNKYNIENVFLDGGNKNLFIKLINNKAKNFILIKESELKGLFYLANVFLKNKNIN